MPKAYWIARVDVRDPERYNDYIATAKPAFEKYGARFLVRGGAYEPLEGKARSRNVVIEFPSLQHARDCYDSPEYQAAKAIRQAVEAGAGATIISQHVVARSIADGKLMTVPIEIPPREFALITHRDRALGPAQLALKEHLTGKNE